MENIDFGEMLAVLSGLAASIIAAGLFFSRWTETDKDDRFFIRLAAIFRSTKKD